MSSITFTYILKALLLGIQTFSKVAMLNNQIFNNVASRGVLMNMVKVLAKQRKGLHVVHINAQSLKNKIDEFRTTFGNSGVDIICVSETWFTASLSDGLVSLAGYTIYRADRKKHAGGVAVYIKQGLHAKVLLKSEDLDAIEYLFLEISIGEQRLFLGSVYRPNRNINTQDLIAKIESKAVAYSDIIIVGDFNSNLLLERTLTESMSSLGLSPTNYETPTHYTSTANTLLDVFFINDPTKMLLYDQLSAPGFSKHDLIYLVYDFQPKMKNSTYTYMDFNRMDRRVLEEEFLKIDWDEIYFMTSVDDQAKHLEDKVVRLYYLAVPLTTITNNKKINPWFTASIKSLIERRDFAYNRWKRFKTVEFKNDFRKARKDVNEEIRKAKMSYYGHRFSTALGSRKTWSTIKEIGIGKNLNIVDQNVNVEELNNTFSNIPTISSNPDFYNEIIDSSEHLYEAFEFSYVTGPEVYSTCMNVRSDSMGYDNIHPRFLKIILPLLLPHITHLFNSIIMRSCFPMKWKHAKIIPIPKAKTEYRPIAILPFLSKVFEKLIHKQIILFLNKHNLLNTKQSGFRAKRGCITALMDVSEDIRRDIDAGKINILVLLDHSKAFDTVDHTILIMKMRHIFNFSNTATKLLSSYLTFRSQSVFAMNTNSNTLPITRGVPQGSILGPLLFSMYANDLPDQLSHCKVHMYADDVQIYLGGNIDTIHETVRKINVDLNKVFIWASANGLCLNPLKSKCIIMRKKSLNFNCNIDVMLNGERVEVVQSAKNLGIHFNATLTWKTHVNAIIGAAYNKLRALWITQYFTPQRIRLMLIKTYIMPTLLYGCEIFSNCDSVSKTKLNLLFNNIVRYVFSLRKYDHISSYTDKIYGVTLDGLFKIKVLTSLQKIIYLEQPDYLYQRLTFSRSNRGRILIPFRHQTLTSEWQFFIHAVRLWNTLPRNIQTTSNAYQFKKALYNIYSNTNG